MYVMRLTASEPRMPSPMKATRTLGMAGQARRITSCCPFGRLGVLVFIVCANACDEKLANRTNKTSVLMILNDDRVKDFIRLGMNWFWLKAIKSKHISQFSELHCCITIKRIKFFYRTLYCSIFALHFASQII